MAPLANAGRALALPCLRITSEEAPPLCLKAETGWRGRSVSQVIRLILTEPRGSLTHLISLQTWLRVLRLAVEPFGRKWSRLSNRELSGSCLDIESQEGGEPQEADSNPDQEGRPKYVGPMCPLQAGGTFGRKKTEQNCNLAFFFWKCSEFTMLC